MSKQGYGDSCISAKTWRYVLNKPRRQENAWSSNTVIRHQNSGTLAPPNRYTKTDVTSDFTTNFENDFDTIDGVFSVKVKRGENIEIVQRGLNRLVCQDVVLANNPKRNHSEAYKLDKMKDYLESLEMAGICRNCKCPIHTKKVSYQIISDFMKYRKDVERRLRATKMPANATNELREARLRSGRKLELWQKADETTLLEYSDIPEHFEVFFDAKIERYVYKHIPQTRVFNSKCECDMREIRKIERADEKFKTDGKVKQKYII